MKPAIASIMILVWGLTVWGADEILFIRGGSGTVGFFEGGSDEQGASIENGDGDGVTLSKEYAYGLNPALADSHIVTPGIGTSGLPSIQLVNNRLRIEFLRRKTDPALVYSPQFSSTLPDGFGDGTATETVTALNLDFERVVIEDSVTTATHGTRFARVLLERMLTP